MAFRSAQSNSIGRNNIDGRNNAASISVGVPDPLRESYSDEPSKHKSNKNNRGSAKNRGSDGSSKSGRNKAQSYSPLKERKRITIVPETQVLDNRQHFPEEQIIERPEYEQDYKEQEVVVTQPKLPTIMRLHHRMLINIFLLVPFFFALLAFSLRQQDFAAQPERVSQVTVRGDILDRSGEVLAQGPAENRVYPNREIAAPLIGFSGEMQADGKHGLEGLEKTLDARLQAGEDVKTTIDLSLQSAAQNVLSDTARSYNAESGTAIVLQAGTGHILAAASYPEYDPNEQARYGADAKNNRVFLQQIDPGSIFKPIVLASLLQDGKLAMSETLSVDMSLEVGQQTFNDVMTHDEAMSVPDLLKYSSNVGMIQVAERFETSELYHWLRDFGFAQPVDLAEHYTNDGSMQHYDKWVPQDQASISIGQGITVTALQLAVAYSVFANDGVLISPRLAFIDNPPKKTPLLEKQLAVNMREMLVSAAQYGGARNSLVEGVRVAGKTGTADAYDVDSGRYIQGEFTTSFAGIFPADEPQAVVVVMLHKPQGEKLYGSTVAAPVFQEIVSAAMSLWEAPR